MKKQRTNFRLLPVPRAVALATLATLASVALAMPAQAQSLLEVYDAARGYDASWQSAKAQYDANLFRAEQARAGVLPQANLSAGVTRSKLDNTVPNIELPYTTQTATASVSQPLYRPANFATYQQGKRQVVLAEAQLTAASQDLIIRVSQAYFDVLAAQDTLAFVRAQKTATAEQLASAKRNFEVGTSTITDQREAQARYDLVISQEIQAENDLLVKRLALDAVVGRPSVKPTPLAVIDLSPPQPANAEVWVQQAEDVSPTIIQARESVEVARLETEKARAAHKPTLDLIASYNITRNPNGDSSVPASTRANNAAIGVSFNLPLFTGFAAENHVRETLSLEEKAQADLETARRTVAQTTRSAYFGLVSGQQQVKALESAEASSQLALEANQLGYQVGVRINIDVLNAQSQLYQTKRDLAQARYNVLLGDLKLRQANGTLAPDDLTRLNSLVVKQ